MAEWATSTWATKLSSFLKLKKSDKDNQELQMDPEIIDRDPLLLDSSVIDEEEEDDGVDENDEQLQSELLAIRRKKRREIIIGFSILSLVFVGLSVFFLFPRSASFNIVDLDIDADNSTFFDGDQMMTNWISTIKVMNFNYYPISIRELRMTAFLNRDRSEPVGYGHGKELYFSSRQETRAKIGFAMPVYAPSTGKPSIIAECMRVEKVELYVDAQVDLAVTHWTGKWIPLHIVTSIDCTIPGMTDLMAQLKTQTPKTY